MSTGTIDLTNLFQGAVDANDISMATFNALGQQDLGADINAALGVDVSELGMGENILLTALIDDSSSIRFNGNTDNIRRGWNMCLKAVEDAKQRSNVLVRTVMMNAGQLHSYVPLDQAIRLSQQNYNPCGGTPLYDMAFKTIAGVMAKWLSNMNMGVQTRTITGIITDGHDEGSREYRPSDNASLVRDLLAQKETNVVFGMGIDDGGTKFRDVFKSMGLSDEWILTPGNSEAEIRKCFELVSRTTQALSQGAMSFSQTAATGFSGVGGGFGGI